MILIDRDTIRDPEEAEAVLAHELAHVERRDWLVLILARVAVALFWFNPLIWLLERHLVEEGEQAADARALARVEPARYAQTLLSCARSYPGLPATGIADNGLARRVKAVRGQCARAPASRPRAAAVCSACSRRRRRAEAVPPRPGAGGPTPASSANRGTGGSGRSGAPLRFAPSAPSTSAPFSRGPRLWLPPARARVRAASAPAALRWR